MTPAVLARVARMVEKATVVHDHGHDDPDCVAELTAACVCAMGKPATPAEVEEVATWLAGVAQHDILEDRILWEYAARALLAALGLTVSPVGAGR